MIARFPERLLFSCAAFFSAALLFSVQPLVARLVTPKLGGAPAVWNTSLVFFQTALLAGYAYAHFAARKLSARQQRWAHLALFGFAALTLPIGLSSSARLDSSEHPISWLLITLTLSVGLPFLALSTQAPLLQHWLARRGQAPFFLYAASNAGSILALVAYPILIEPTLGLASQVRWWSFGFLALIPFIWFAAKPSQAATPAVAETVSTRPDWRTRLVWLGLAFLPSSLLQGVTSFLTADIASVPLLWMAPLAIYLLTFVVAFAESKRPRTSALELPFIAASVCLVLLLALDVAQPASLLLLIHLAAFAMAALYCHCRLAELRPSAEHLTEFYLWMSIGGAAGGFFNALVAPSIFTRVIEYPLVIVLACLARPAKPGTSVDKIGDVLMGALFVMLGCVAALVEKMFHDESVYLASGIGFGALAIACFLMKERPVRLALTLGGLLVGSNLAGSSKGIALHAERNFFGVLRVTLDPVGPYHRMYHGTTIHGIQSAKPDWACVPLSYYAHGSGFQRMWQFARASDAATNIALVGLGAGTMLTYGEEHQRWTTFEIDPAVVRIANDTNLFSFLRCTRAKIQYAMGDARVRMEEAARGAFDLVILDAFSSDSVPMHLLTREAMRMYRERLAPGGRIFAHVSSRHLRLEPVVANGAAAEDMAVFEPVHLMPTDDRATFPSAWLLVLPAGEITPELLNERQWRLVRPDANFPTWTDDFCNLWSVISRR
jgi:hypothetical protein